MGKVPWGDWFSSSFTQHSPSKGPSGFLFSNFPLTLHHTPRFRDYCFHFTSKAIHAQREGPQTPGRGLVPAWSFRSQASQQEVSLNIMRLNYLETNPRLPHHPGPRKNRLPLNWSLVPRGWGPQLREAKGLAQGCQSVEAERNAHPASGTSMAQLVGLPCLLPDVLGLSSRRSSPQAPPSQWQTVRGRLLALSWVVVHGAVKKWLWGG